MTAFDVSIAPSTAAPSSRVRFSGRGFTQPGAVYGHYLYKGRVRKTVRLAKAPGAPCGTFKVKRRQIPVKKPRTGRWTLQADTVRQYSKTPASVFVRLAITVKRVLGSR